MSTGHAESSERCERGQSHIGLLREHGPRQLLKM
jgi:hypothetical protein